MIDKSAAIADCLYGIFVDTLGPRLTPRVLYRVWTNDGHEEMVVAPF